MNLRRYLTGPGSLNQATLITGCSSARKALTHWLLPGRTHAELPGPADGTLAGDGGTSVFKGHILSFQGVGLLTAFKAVDLVTGSTGHRLLLLNVSYE